jgi:hypothetical protein
MQTKEGVTVKRTLNLDRPPPLTPDQKARLEALEAMPDDQIDYSDAPYLPNAVWVRASDRGRLRKREKSYAKLFA